MTQFDNADCKAAIHLLRSGKTPAETAEELKRSLAWVYKWWKRYLAEADWHALEEQSRVPKRQPTRLSQVTCQAIRQARSELEAEANEPDKLSYIGAHAVRSRLRQKGMRPLPGVSSIERVLHLAGMTRPYHPAESVEIIYPHVRPLHPHELIQVDIFPRYLTGGDLVSCFNALDVVSRYPHGEQHLTKRSGDAASFLLHVWQELGIPTYTQVDNESCFSGGFTHPAVFGKVVRLALLVGTQLVFSPVYHPESNAFVERFHQDYGQNVWDKVQLPDLTAVRTHSAIFFTSYRSSQHHSALNGCSPAELHFATPIRTLPTGFRVLTPLPVSVGEVHFIRRVTQERTVSVLNLKWDVPAAQPDQGVWVTLAITARTATLRVYDTAPDVSQRLCLAEHPFPIRNPVQQTAPPSRHSDDSPSWRTRLGNLAKAVLSRCFSTMS
ncbi:integrase core domain-containing protein [Candidatus Amarolinea aalborgensis]|jgi:hypothetical protein|uniref:integrase core domain-containing protein n=1 Tax=Candidatus Amarolinea aalborgensis TaxID=2249329 RepID=UPI003BF9C59E